MQNLHVPSINVGRVGLGTLKEQVPEVDRDADIFPYILKFLRSQQLLGCPAQLLPGVLLEAEFFGVDGLVQHIRDKCALHLTASRHWPLGSAREKFDERFPATVDILNSPFFSIHVRCEYLG